MIPSAAATRRQLLGWLAAAPLTARADRVPGVTPDRIAIGQTIAMSGPFGELGKELVRGAQAFLRGLQEAGGIHGRRLELLTQDDGYSAPKALENVQGWVASGSVFCLFNTFGTPTNEALLPLVESTGTPLFAPYSGALSLRGAQLKSVVNLRASYAAEAEHLVRHLETTGIRRIAVVHQANTFGQEILQGITESLVRRGLKAAWTAPIQPDASDAVQVATQALQVRPEALLLAVSGKSTLDVIRTVNGSGSGMQLYALSVLGTPANLKALGRVGRGVVMTQVVPMPGAPTLPVAREYRAAMEAAGQGDALNHVSFEGFLNAKVLAEVLRRSGRELTRRSLAQALAGLRQLDVGGLTLNLAQGAASASTHVELTMIDSAGKLIR